MKNESIEKKDSRESDGYLVLLALTLAVKDFNEPGDIEERRKKAFLSFDIADNLLINSNLDRSICQVIGRVKETILRDWHDALQSEKEEAGKSLYMLRHPITGHVKIGFSSQPKHRISVIQVNVPAPLEVLGIGPGTTSEESGIHKQFKADRVSGEWFLDSAEIREAFFKAIAPKQQLLLGVPV